MKFTTHVRSIRGFTLIETLIVIGIIGLLVGLVLGGVQKARAAAERTSCKSKMREIGLGLANFQALNGYYPSYKMELYKSRVLWQAHILPFIEQHGLWQKTVEASQQEPWSFADPPHDVNHAVVPIYVCASDWRLGEPKRSRVGALVGLSSYVALAPHNQDGVLTTYTKQRPENITDGLSMTLIIGERPPPNSWDAGWWYAGNMRGEWFAAGAGPNGFVIVDYDLRSDPRCSFCFGPGRVENEGDRRHSWSMHPGGGNFLAGDGSVRFFAYSAAPRLRALASMAGGEAVAME